MSNQARRAVKKYSQSKGNARLLLLCIADYADENGAGANPSVPTLARDAALTRTQAQKWLSHLCELGELEITTGGGHKSNEYSILLPMGFLEAAFTQRPPLHRGGCSPQVEASDALAERHEHVHAVNDVNETTCMHVVDDVSFGINASSASNVQTAADALRQHGVDEPMASNLAREDPEECLRQVDWLPLRKGVREVHSFLVDAIRRRYAAPSKKAVSATAKPAATAPRAATPQTESSTRSAVASNTVAPIAARQSVAPPQGTVELSHDPKRAAIEREDRDNAALDAQFEAMPDSERAALRALAEERMSFAPAFLRSEIALRSMIRTLMREK